MGGQSKICEDIIPFSLPNLRPPPSWEVQNEARIQFDKDIYELRLKTEHFTNLGTICPPVTLQVIQAYKQGVTIEDEYKLIRNVFSQHLGYEIVLIPDKQLQLFYWKLQLEQTYLDRKNFLEETYPEGCIPF